MAWNRKTTNSSTFTTPDGSSSASLTPGFTLWTPSANLTEKVWELGSLWTANTANDGSYLKFKYNNVDLFTVTQSGFETPKTRSTTLVALPDIADASYLAGDIVNYNGILYLKEA
tara:strand:- start:25 stop:369 length:345 start_codon:yes stop_codon:yes gene_type:complete